MWIPKLTCRCRPSSFRTTCDQMEINEEVMYYLTKLGVNQFLRLPAYQQNIPLIIELLSRWSVEKQTFFLNDTEIKFTADEVALIIGMPNKGHQVCWSLNPPAKHSAIHIKAKIKAFRMTDDLMRFVRLFLKFLLSNLFFPLNNYKVPVALMRYAMDPQTFSEHNWSEAIHQFLVSQLNVLAQKRVEGKALGYMSGFATILMIWFLEHTSIMPPRSKNLRPRILRWPDGISKKTTGWAMTFASLRNRVSLHFFDITPEEVSLLSSGFSSLGPIASSSSLEDSSIPFCTNRLGSQSSSPLVLVCTSPSNPSSPLALPFLSPSFHPSTLPPPSPASTSAPAPAPTSAPPAFDPSRNCDEHIASQLQRMHDAIADLHRDVVDSRNAIADLHCNVIDSRNAIANLHRDIVDSRDMLYQEIAGCHTCMAADIITLRHQLTVLEKKVEVANQIDEPSSNHLESHSSKLEKAVVAAKVAEPGSSQLEPVDATSMDDELSPILPVVEPASSHTIQGHHQMKRSFPWEEVVTISLDDSSDSDSKEHKQNRAKRNKKDCSSENLGDNMSEDTLIRMAGMYQNYMKRIAIPTFSGSVIPFTSWQGLAKSLKQVYGQPLHYLTNVLLKQWDRERFGSDNEAQPLDALVHPLKAQTLIWLTEELHRLTVSPYYLSQLWASDPMYHSLIDPFLSSRNL